MNHEGNFSSIDARQTQERYSARFKKHGYSPLTLGWNKGRQPIRFEALISAFCLKGKRVLDIGCGFGDLNRTLTEKFGNDYEYIGIDIVPELIDEAKRNWNFEHIQFLNADTSAISQVGEFDVAIASGVFNHRLEQTDSYSFINRTLKEAAATARVGVACDFLSSKVDRRLEHAFHSEPSRILDMAFDISRRVMLRNDYLPFEFAVFIFTDDKVNKDNSCYANPKL